MSEQPATVRFRLEVFDPIRRAPGTFVLGFVAMCLVVWLLFVLLNENHMNLFVGLQIGFQAFALHCHLAPVRETGGSTGRESPA